MRLSKDSNLPLVSVCIQTFQHGPYIRECLDSVVEQRVNFPLEVIVGEDESTDGTREICLEYASKYPDLIRLFLRNRNDVIYVNARPTGRFNMIENIKASRGKYIALLEGDDYWTDPLKLQKQVDYLESNPDCVVCHHWQKVAEMDESGHYVVKAAPTMEHGYYPAPKATVEKILANQLRVKSRTIMFRNILTDFPEWFHKVAYGDVPLSMILGKYGNFGFINEPMAVYRQTGRGASSHGKKGRLFIYNQYIEWIRIWEFSIKHYEGKYLEEALGTIHYFYNVILTRYKYSFRIFKKTVQYALLRSSLPLLRRVVISYSLLMSQIKGRTGRE